MAEKLTKKQKVLLQELDEIYDLLGMDHWNILDYEKEARTPKLEGQKNQIIRSSIIIQYTLIDELITTKICHFFFGRKHNFTYLWRTKKFKIFNYHILENLFLLKKLELAQVIKPIPKKLISNILALNNLRNSIAHSFFPENLKKSKPEYKGKNIFTMNGVKVFIDDMGELFDFFVQKY